MFKKEQLEHGNWQLAGVQSPSNPDIGVKEGLCTLDNGLAPDEVIVEIDRDEGRRILRKIDFRLITLLASLYL